MESKTKNRIAFFAVGLAAGIGFGVVFGYAIRAGLSRFNFLHSSLNKIDSRQSQISLRIDSIESKMQKKDADAKHVKGYQTNTSGTRKPNVTTVNKIVSVDTESSMAPATETHRMHTGDRNTEDSSVVVMTDEMVAFRLQHLTNLDSLSNSNAAKNSDSVIGVLNEGTSQSGIDDYRIEFWESPINLKGYKMSAGKLILFGINSTTPVKLVHYGGQLYLIAGQEVYRTVFTDDFRPFERVVDRNLIKKMKG